MQLHESKCGSSSSAIFTARHWRNLGIELAPGRTGNFQLIEQARFSVRKFIEAVDCPGSARFGATSEYPGLLIERYFCAVYDNAGKADLSKGYWNQ